MPTLGCGPAVLHDAQHPAVVCPPHCSLHGIPPVLGNSIINVLLCLLWHSPSSNLPLCPQEIAPILGWDAVLVQGFLLTLIAAVLSYFISSWSDPGFYVTKSGTPTSPEADNLRIKYNEVVRSSFACCPSPTPIYSGVKYVETGCWRGAVQW